MRVLRVYFIIFWGKLHILIGQHTFTNYSFILANSNISLSSKFFLVQMRAKPRAATSACGATRSTTSAAAAPTGGTATTPPWKYAAPTHSELDQLNSYVWETASFELREGRRASGYIAAREYWRVIRPLALDITSAAAFPLPRNTAHSLFRMSC
jgi:hypothetical protein